MIGDNDTEHVSLSVAPGNYHMFADVLRPGHIPELTVTFHIPKVHRQHSSLLLRVDATSGFQSLPWGDRHLHSFMRVLPPTALKARPTGASTRGPRQRRAGLVQQTSPSKKDR